MITFSPADLNLRWIEPNREPELIAALNHSAGVERHDVISDYGRLHCQTEGFWLFQPTSAAEAAAGWLRLIKQGNRPRIRGAGHSMHGGSVPRAGEVLLSTLRLTDLHWDLHNPAGARVTAGAGAQVWVVDALARRLGYRLPVVHDGGAAAASVGGFISAGGFGVDSDLYGGFWNHVHQLDRLNADGDSQQLTPEDPDFWDCFGGGGTGHLIVAAELRLLPLAAATTTLQPHATDLPLPQRAALEVQQHEPLLWFTLIAPADQEWRLRPIIAKLHLQFQHFWAPEPPYRYPIARLTQATPVRFHSCSDQDLIACGVWGVPLIPREQLVQPMLAAIEEQLRKNPGIERYWQSELSLNPR
jgi:hypothetical protein